MTDEERMLWTENGRLQGRVSELEAEVSKLLNTLADERTENMRLRAALGPFAKAADGFDMRVVKNPEDWFAYSGITSGIDGTIGAITVGDLRRARAALEGK